MRMPMEIHLLGYPSIGNDDGPAYRFRSRKSWAVLAFLVLAERSPTRTQLATLLFGSADDPLRALRWSLAEIRRALGEHGSVDGDPVVLDLSPGSKIDVETLTHGDWTEAVGLPGLGHDVLEGMAFKDAPAFESWLLSERSRFGAAAEATIHQAALSSLSGGSHSEAIDLAVRLAGMNPYDENHQALLIRCYRMAGDDRAARKQYEACVDLYARELGVEPGPAVRNALDSPLFGVSEIDQAASADAFIEAGAAAVAAGAVEAGVDSLRAAVVLSDKARIPRLRVSSRLALAEALIHSLRGEDEEGSAVLHVAREIAPAAGDDDLAARVLIELGYVDFLRARYDSAKQFLASAQELSDGRPELMAKASTYLGAVCSDRAEYRESFQLLEQGVESAQAARDRRVYAYALAMLGRARLLRGELDDAVKLLDRSISAGMEERWLAFLPWPQALKGEAELALGDLDGATEGLNHAFARACQLGDPCWEGVSARGLALAAEARGATERGFEILADARLRCNRLSDTYVWLDVYILDAQCRLGLAHDHPQTRAWVDAMNESASRTGMREHLARSLLHRQALGDPESGFLAQMLIEEMDNPLLRQMGQGPGHRVRETNPRQP